MTHPVEKAPLILTKIGAQKLTDRIRQKLASADRDLAQAWQTRAWELLGFESWAAYCADLDRDLELVKLRPEARQEFARGLRLVGASERDIAAATGVSRGQTHADLQALRERGELAGEPTTTRGRDGRDRPARQPATGAESRAVAQTERHGLTILMHEAWQHVERGYKGQTGMTCWELEKTARWRHGRASSLLHRLENWPAGALVQRTEERRDGYRVYLALPLD
jgi:hypothetical protein